MADNYLERRQESYREQSGQRAVKRSSVPLVGLAQRVQAASFDASYRVRPDQLCRMVEAASVIGGSCVQCYIVPACGTAVVACEFDGSAQWCDAFILLGLYGATENEHLISVGRCLQMMQLQAAEMGLCVEFTLSLNAASVAAALELSFKPLVLLAVGKPAK